MMEKKCKNGGESLKNRYVENEDRISELPEALLLKILSSVPTKNVIATSVLSKEWRSLWKMVPNLMFDSELHGSKHHSFSEIVSRSLLSHKAPVLESLHLVVAEKSAALDVGIWIGIAFARNVRKLVLDLRTGRIESFPNVLWSCDKLETLELKGFLLKFLSPVCFKSLKKLQLDYVNFYDEESVSNLFSGCPRLEDLYTCGSVDVETFTIDVPSLQRLTIEEYYAGRYVINAPSLKYFNISEHDWIESCLISAPEVVEAKIDVSYLIENENILTSIVSVKRLFLKSPLEEFEFPTGIIYHQLASLELSTEEDWDLLPLMLESSPRLQILKLTDPTRGEKDWPDGWEWSEPKRVPECLLFHLETFVWKSYEWQREEEKEVALYILKNARHLKKAFISAKCIKPAKLQKMEKTCEKSLQKLEKSREALEKLEKRREALQKLEKRREQSLKKLEKRREALQKLEKSREAALQKLEKRSEALKKLGKRREAALEKLKKRREALQNVEKRREAHEKLEKRRVALQKLEKRLEALQKLEKRREESLQKLQKRRDALQKLKKRRDALQKLKKRHEALEKLKKRGEALKKLKNRREALEKLENRREEALEKLEKTREEALKKLEKRREEALEKFASEVKVFNPSCHLVLDFEPYH